MKPLSESEQLAVKNLRLVADAIENDWAVEENDGVHAEWRPIDTRHDFAVCSFFAYRVACSPIDGELANDIRTFFRRSFIPPVAKPKRGEIQSIIDRLGITKDGGP